MDLNYILDVKNKRLAIKDQGSFGFNNWERKRNARLREKIV